MARRLLGPGPTRPDHAATKQYVDVFGGSGGGGEGGPAVWGHILGELGDQEDLTAALDAKADADHEHHYSEISGLGTAAIADVADFASADQGERADSAVQPADLAPVATGGDYGDLSGLPVLGSAAATEASDYATAAQGGRADTAVQPGDLAAVATSGAYTDLDGTPALAEVALSGSYTDLDDTPALTGVALSGSYHDLADTPVFAEVALSGSYADLTDSPVLAEVAASGRYDDLIGAPAALTDFDTTTTGAELDAMAAKLDGIEPGAQANVTVDWEADSGPAAIANRPVLGSAAATDADDYATADQGERADSAVQPGDLAAVATTGRYVDLKGTPALAPVATTGAYTDLTGLPDIPDALTDLDTTVTGAQLDILVDSLDSLPVGTGAIRGYIDAEVATRAPVAHTHSAGQITGLTKASVGLGQVDNTADADKPVSAATAAALAAKQDALGFVPEDRANRDAPGGYPSLDSSGKLRVTQLPNSVMEYQGAWDAINNVPPLADGVGNAGDVYRIVAEATRDLGSGPIEWGIGQYAIYNGFEWERSGASEGVSSVAGRTGDVELTKADVGLANVDNTSDADKPISAAAAAALATKADASAVVHRHLDEEITGTKVFTGELAHFQQWNMMHLINTLPDQYSGAGFKVYSSAETMTGPAGAQFSVFISDEDASESALEMATIDRDGQFLDSLFQFDLDSHRMKLTGPLDMNSHKVTGVSAGTGPNDVVIRAQLDAKANTEHTHDADDITGVLHLDRIPTIPPSKLGAGHVQAFADGEITDLEIDILSAAQWGTTTPLSDRVYMVFED